MSFSAAATAAANDRALQLERANAALKLYTQRRERWEEFADIEALRTLAGRIRQHALDHLDHYLGQFKANLEKRGGVVHLAETADDARRIILKLARENGCARFLRGQAPVGEEVDLFRHLERAGLEIAGDGQSSADMGITGGSFLVAETGQVCIVEDQPDARRSSALPRIVVSVAGIEAALPRLDDLLVMLKLLGRSAGGPALGACTTLLGGPRTVAEKDGPEQFHLVLVDNGRSRILAGEYREALRCIHCTACHNACPVYRTIGGPAYGHVHTGPIGAVLAPLLGGLAAHRDLPYASTLCGACGEACPVKIDLPGLLVRLRRDLVAGSHIPWRKRMIQRLWTWMTLSPARYRLAMRRQRRSRPAGQATFRQFWAQRRQ